MIVARLIGIEIGFAQQFRDFFGLEYRQAQVQRGDLGAAYVALVQRMGDGQQASILETEAPLGDAGLMTAAWSEFSVRPTRNQRDRAIGKSMCIYVRASLARFGKRIHVVTSPDE
jgi:hypothetical protein